MSLAYRLIALLLALVLAGPGHSQDSASDEEPGLKYRLLGPANGGRASRVVGIPGDPSTYYLATAAGGVWKSSNGGMSWKSVFDDQPVSSIGSVAVASGNPAKPIFAAMSVRATASTGHWMRAKPGTTSGQPRVRLERSLLVRMTIMLFSLQRSAARSVRGANAVFGAVCRRRHRRLGRGV
jgi:hypothetical protein